MGFDLKKVLAKASAPAAPKKLLREVSAAKTGKTLPVLPTEPVKGKKEVPQALKDIIEKRRSEQSEKVAQKKAERPAKKQVQIPEVPKKSEDVPAVVPEVAKPETPAVVPETA